MKKSLGKIASISFGNGGYQNCMFGLSLRFDCSSGSVGDFYGTWPITREIPNDAEYTKSDMDKEIVKVVTLITETMKKAGVKDLYQLVGVPVECTYDGQMLKSWRILEEVL